MRVYLSSLIVQYVSSSHVPLFSLYHNLSTRLVVVSRQSLYLQPQLVSLIRDTWPYPLTVVSSHFRVRFLFSSYSLMIYHFANLPPPREYVASLLPRFGTHQTSRIIPQAVCVRYGLSIGAKCVPLVLCLMWILGMSSDSLLPISL